MFAAVTFYCCAGAISHLFIHVKFMNKKYVLVNKKKTRNIQGKVAAHVCSAVSTYCSCQKGKYIANRRVASGLYVPHIIEPHCRLASTVMAAPHGLASGRQRRRDTLFWFSEKWLWTGTVVLDLQFPPGCVKFLFQLIPPSSQLNCVVQWTVKWT